MSIEARTPLYVRLANTIERNITDGVWRMGSKIPSERELIEMYGMSRITVRKAIDELERQGLVERVQGKGTFVVSRGIVQSLGGMYSFSREMERQGKIASTRLLERGFAAAPHNIATNLGLEDGARIIFVNRLRCADADVPIMFERTYFSADRYPFVMDIDLDHRSLYQTLETEYGVTIDKALERFKACAITREEGELLGCREGHYGLLVKRVSFSGSDLVCYSSIVSKGDSFEFTVMLES